MVHQNLQNSSKYRIVKKSDILFLEKINNFLEEGCLYKILKPLVLISYDKEEKPLTAENFVVGDLCLFINAKDYYEDRQLIIKTQFFYNNAVCTLEINDNAWLDILKTSLKKVLS